MPLSIPLISLRVFCKKSFLLIWVAFFSEQVHSHEICFCACPLHQAIWVCARFVCGHRSCCRPANCRWLRNVRILQVTLVSIWLKWMAVNNSWETPILPVRNCEKPSYLMSDKHLKSTVKKFWPCANDVEVNFLPPYTRCIYYTMKIQQKLWTECMQLGIQLQCTNTLILQNIC